MSPKSYLPRTWSDGPISETQYLAFPSSDTAESLDVFLNHSCDPLSPRT